MASIDKGKIELGDKLGNKVAESTIKTVEEIEKDNSIGLTQLSKIIGMFATSIENRTDSPLLQFQIGSK